MSELHYWRELSSEAQEQLRQITPRFVGLVPGIGPDGTVNDGVTVAALVEFLNMEAALNEEYTYWQRLYNEVLEAFADWQSRTRRTYVRNGWPWTTDELNRRSRLWGHE
ncbi:hypothetical protein QN239_20320 [Mycolicibacterium sp. Y3]